MKKLLLIFAIALASCESENPCGYGQDWHQHSDGTYTCVTPADGIEDKLTNPGNNIDPELMPYFRAFIDIAMLEGIDLSFIYDQKITIKFTDYDNNNHVATSFGRDKDHVMILVHRARFANRTEQGRKYVMWHEFGHDILDLPHSGDVDMMRATAYSGFFKDTVDDGRQTQYLYNSLKGMLDHYKTLQGDGILNTGCEDIKQLADGLAQGYPKVMYSCDGKITIYVKTKKNGWAELEGTIIGLRIALKPGTYNSQVFKGAGVKSIKVIGYHRKFTNPTGIRTITL